MPGDGFERITNGVFVITSSAGGKDNGMTAAWVSRASHVPALVMVSVGKRRHSLGMIKASGSFCVNILSEGQLSLAKNFGFASGSSTDKFRGIEYKRTGLGNPLMEGLSGYLDCRLVHTYDAGDHEIIVGEVVEGEDFGRTPLPCRMDDFF